MSKKCSVFKTLYFIDLIKVCCQAWFSSDNTLTDFLFVFLKKKRTSFLLFLYFPFKRNLNVMKGAMLTADCDAGMT